jgi:large subunit ribosomal protein L10
MPSQRNIHSLAEIVKSLNDSKAAIFTQYSGLSVADQTALRNEASKNGGSFMVAKNNLLRRALTEKSKELADQVDTVLNGQTAVYFGADPVAASKTVTKFMEDHEQLQIKSAIFEDKVATVADIKAYSKLPSREQLLASLLAQLQAPAQALVRQLSAPIQNFVYGLEALKVKLSA